MRVSVIIPTRNEAEALAHVLADLPAGLVHEVLVVDSSSTDGTPDVAARMGARVIAEPRRGYGQACLTGIAHASSPDIVVFLDGDYSDRPAELPALLAPIVEGRADIAIGSRLSGSRARRAMPWHAAFGNRLAAFLINVLFRQHITDLGPFRAARADVLRRLALAETTYGWAVEMILKGALHGCRVVEVPVSYHPRIGQSKISGTVRGTVGAAWFIFSRILRYSLRRRRSGAAGCTLVIMAKAARPGAVKTRLAACLPADAIPGLYRCLLEDTIALARSLDGVAAAMMCPAADVEDLRRLADGTMPVVPQKGSGLAAGLDSVFEHFSAEGPRRIVAFNSDSPHLPASVLLQAFEALDSSDLVVGPTHDGGYYLVGASAPHPGLFAAGAMGTASALETLLAHARSLGLSVRSTSEFYDVDVPSDLNRLAAELRLAPQRAPRTAAWLAEWTRTTASPFTAL
ncbi:MAG TPA: TIGR04282 family arsenosugar biosynthesis glycosyltransferase [Candidatus Acidoferrales bacterium]|nr:TIGR04282 family arsenosugar biosynthesis glycosyltransferase [Candidatus Acidoferrales bacterium]